jgi:hypothetical protein
LKNKVAAERFGRLDDALDDLVPARWVDDGVIDRRDDIGVVRHREAPPRKRANINTTRPIF